MKKLSFLFFFILIQSNLIFSQTDSLKELTGFRNYKWGSTVNEVKSSEHEYYLQSFSGFGVYALSYTSRFAGFKTRIDYTFKKGELVEGTYTFNPIEDVRSAFKILQKTLIGEYGKPSFTVGPLIDSASVWIMVTKYGRYKGPELYWKFNNGFIALVASKFEDDVTITILYANNKSINEYNKEREIPTKSIF